MTELAHIAFEKTTIDILMIVFMNVKAHQTLTVVLYQTLLHDLHLVGIMRGILSPTDHDL